MSPDPSVVAAQALHRTLTREGTGVELRGGRFFFGPTVLDLKAEVENEGQRDGMFLLGMSVHLAVDGKVIPALQMGAVGWGSTRAEALEEAASDWSAYVGTALARLFNPDPAQKSPEKPFQVFGGALGIRGPVDGDLLERLRAPLERVVERFAAALTASDGAPLHSLLVMVYIGPTGLEDGECRCDGRISPELMQAVRPLPWPPASPRYIFKRFYLVHKRSA